MDYNKLYEELPKIPLKWTVRDMEIWLRFIGLNHIYPAFKELSVDGSCINTLTEQDLREQLHIQSGIIVKKIMSCKSCQKQGSIAVSNNTPPSSKANSTKLQISEKSPKNHEINVGSTYNQQQLVGPKPIIAPEPAVPVPAEPAAEEESAMVEEEEGNRMKEYELIIQQSDGPQTSFFSVKQEGAKIGRHSSNQILILDESISRYHAEIKFENGGFYLKDIGSTTGTFIKIQQPKLIEDKMIIEMGSNQFEASFINGNLGLSIVEGPAQETFFQIPRNDAKVTVGRKPNNTIYFVDDQHLSNLHATITCADGRFYIEDMGTTNGTWQRLSTEGAQSDMFQIVDGTVFKIGTNQTYVCKIKVSLVKQQHHPNACVICCDSDKDCVYLPCKHNTACIKCSKNLKECPICREKITDFVRIYKN